MSVADEIILSATVEPAVAVKWGQEHLANLEPSDHVERSKTLRAMSLAARYSNQIVESIRYAEQAADEGAESGSEELEYMARLTMSGSLAINGWFEEALEVIESSLGKVTDPLLSARFRYQRGGVLVVLGRNPEAVEVFTSVLPVFREFEDQSSEGLALGQLGSLLVEEGELDRAEGYLKEAMELALATEDLVSVSGIEHNLGELAAYRGDIPAALEQLTRSDERYMEFSGATAPQHVARCEVLLGVGLYREALELAGRIAIWNQTHGDLEHEVNALVVACQAALLGNNPARAAELAGQVIERLGPTSEAVRALEAKRVLIETRFELEGPVQEQGTEAASLAERLAADGHPVAAGQAHLLAGRVAIALGDRVAAEENLGRVMSVSSGPAETRIQAWLARALLALSKGDGRGADAAARAGMRLLARYQAALGATDLRTGLERQGEELAGIGIGLALDSRRARRVFQWMERTRAGALRHRPVNPERDRNTRGLLEELRRLEAGMRNSDGPLDPEMARRRRVLQDRIANAHRTTRGNAGQTDSVDLEELSDALDECTLVEIGTHGDRMFAVVSGHRRWQFVDLGSVSGVLAELGHVRFALRRAAVRGRALEPEALDRLSAMVLGDIVPADQVVIVPPPRLMALPWAALPDLRGRTVTVSPSAHMWLTATGEVGRHGNVFAVAGPDLDHAADEARKVAGEYRVSSLAIEDLATVDSVRSSLEGVSIAHLACHAVFQSENPMFSSLRLHDGDLYVYDIERLERPPQVVVLSACDSGYTETRAGDELAGLTSALLSMGTANVVASIGLVPDAGTTVDLMVEFHAGLVAGLTPAQALIRAQTPRLAEPETFVSAASFLCVGG